MNDRENGQANDKREDHPAIGRRSMLAKVSAGAVAGLAVSAPSLVAQSAPQQFEPARHSLDAWLNELPGSHRIFIDSSTTHGGANALRYANNILTVHQDAYSGTAADLAIVVCFRHESTPYAFDDAIWAKYGAGLDRSADPPPTANPMNTATGANGGNSIGDMVAKGVQFAICSRATRAFAGGLARSAGVPVDDIVKELMAGAIPNSRFVPAGVMTVTRAQEYSYSLVYAE